MTRLPDESWDMIGLPGPELKVGPYCSVPGCNRIIDHAHHIVRRSFLAGAYDWVKMPDGVEIGNLAGMCFMHHQLITENKAWIAYENGAFFYSPNGEEGLPLNPQPPLLHDDQPEEMYDGRVICPGCGRPMPKPKIETAPEDRKPRGTWAVSVPADEKENGADVLDELLDAARDELDKAGISYGNGNRVKYYQLSTALALFVQHAEQVLSDS